MAARDVLQTKGITLNDGDILYTGAQYIYVKTGEIHIEPNGRLTGNYVIEIIADWEADMHKGAGARITIQDQVIPIHIFT